MCLLILERGEGRTGGERETETCEKHPLVASHTHPSWGRTCNLPMCPHQELNPQPFGVRDDAPTTEPHQQMCEIFLIQISIMRKIVFSEYFVRNLIKFLENIFVGSSIFSHMPA